MSEISEIEKTFDKLVVLVERYTGKRIFGDYDKDHDEHVYPYACVREINLPEEYSKSIAVPSNFYLITWNLTVEEMPECAKFAILAHELGHILAGHLDYTNEELAMHSKERSEGKYVAMLREASADLFATRVSRKGTIAFLQVMIGIYQKDKQYISEACEKDKSLVELASNSIMDLSTSIKELKYRLDYLNL